MSDLTLRESMLPVLAAALQARLEAAAEGLPDTPDETVLEGWLACWALAAAGSGTALPALAGRLLSRPAPAQPDLQEEGPGRLPAPLLQAAAGLALWQAPLIEGGDLAPQRAAIARDLHAAWRPGGRFAFTSGLLPVEPMALQEALVAAAWVRLPEPVPDRRLVRARKVLSHLLARRREAAGDGKAALLWAAFSVADWAGLEDALPSLSAAVQALCRSGRPVAPLDRAATALALASGLGGQDAVQAAAIRREAERCLEEGGAAALVKEPLAAALAVAALALLPAPADGPGTARPAPLRPALRR